MSNLNNNTNLVGGNFSNQSSLPPTPNNNNNNAGTSAGGGGDLRTQAASHNNNNNHNNLLTSNSINKRESTGSVATVPRGNSTNQHAKNNSNPNNDAGAGSFRMNNNNNNNNSNPNVSTPNNNNNNRNNSNNNLASPSPNYGDEMNANNLVTMGTNTAGGMTPSPKKEGQFQRQGSSANTNVNTNTNTITTGTNSSPNNNISNRNNGDVNQKNENKNVAGAAAAAAAATNNPGTSTGGKETSTATNPVVVTRQQRRHQQRANQQPAEPTANLVIRGVMEKLQIVNHGRIVNQIILPNSVPNNNSPNHPNNNNTGGPAGSPAAGVSSGGPNNTNGISLLQQHQLQQQQLALGHLGNATYNNSVNMIAGGAGSPMGGLGKNGNTPNNNNPQQTSPQNQQPGSTDNKSSGNNNNNNVSANNNNPQSPIKRRPSINNNDQVAGSANNFDFAGGGRNADRISRGEGSEAGGGGSEYNLASSRASSFSVGSSTMSEGGERRRRAMKSIFDGQLRAGHNQGCYVPVTLLGKGSYGQAYLVVYKPSEQELALQQEYNLEQERIAAEKEKLQNQQQQQQSQQGQNQNQQQQVGAQTTTTSQGGNTMNASLMANGNKTDLMNPNNNNNNQANQSNANVNASAIQNSAAITALSPQYHKTRPKLAQQQVNNDASGVSTSRKGNLAGTDALGVSQNQGNSNVNQSNTNASAKNNTNNTKDGQGGSGSDKNNAGAAIPAQGHTSMENGQVSFTSRPSGGPAGNAGISTLACTKPSVTISGVEYQREYIFVCKVEKDYDYEDAQKKRKVEEEKKRKKLEKRRLRLMEQQQQQGGNFSPKSPSHRGGPSSPRTSRASGKNDNRKLGDSSTSDDNDFDAKSAVSDNDDVKSVSSVSSATSSRVADDAGRDRAKRMRNEAAVLANLAHPCIVGFVDSFNRSGNSYLVLEYVDGGDLNKEIARRRASRAGYMTRDSILFIWAQVVLAVEYLHRHNILHRDIKAANVLLSRKWIIRLSDLGTAEQFDADVRKGVSNVPMGSPMMMAPELFMGDPTTGVRKVYDEKCDIWSLGVLLWELTFFTYPFDGRDIRELAHHIVHDEPRPVARERTPRELAFLISWMMKKDASQRPTAKQILSLDFMQKPILSIIERYQQAADSKNATPLDRMWVNVLKEHHKAILSDSNPSQVSRAMQAKDRSVKARARSMSRGGTSVGAAGGFDGTTNVGAASGNLNQNGNDDDNNNNNNNNNTGRNNTNNDNKKSPSPASAAQGQQQQRMSSNVSNMTKLTTPGHVAQDSSTNCGGNSPAPKRAP